jgi:hypothetical protein
MGAQDVSLVVDFETLGVSRDCIVLSGAAICFQGDKVLWKEYREFGVEQQIYDGSTIDKPTVDWWKRTDASEFDRLLFEAEASGQTVDEFMRHIHTKAGKIKELWSRGHMDFEIFNYHLGRRPLEYYVFRDIRTLDSLGLAKMKPNEHNALKDCENELEYLLEVLKKCQELKQEDLTELPVSPGVGIPLVFPKSICQGQL